MRLWQRNRERLLDALSIASLLLCAVPVAAETLDLAIVYTPSVPRGIYRMHDLEERPLRPGDYVCVEGWRPAAPEAIRQAAHRGQVPRSWVQGERLAKRVAGIAGDRIEYVQGHLEVNGVAVPQSTVLEHDSAGGRLPHPSLPYRLQDGEVWLASDHDRGFDSRYFGAVRLAALSCRGELWWRW